MRLKTLLLLIVCLSLTKTNAQVNTYLQNGLIWQMSSSCADPYPCIVNDDYNYYFNGDTTINSLVYKKVFRKGQGYRYYSGGGPNNCSGTFSYIETAPRFLLRSSGKQIYIVTQGVGEMLLYDFDLQVNDTLPLTYNNSANDVTVTAIDSFYTSMGYRKRFTLAGYTWSQYLIEGVGHSNGLIETMQPPLECGFNLTCFGIADSAFYPVAGPTCNIPVSVRTLNENAGLEIQPNPAKDFISIRYQGYETIKLISVYNALGAVVLSIPFRNEATVDLTSLSKGIYYIKAESSSDVLVKKIIKE
jgi:hypothetical protein